MGWRSASSFRARSSISCWSCVDAGVAAHRAFRRVAVAPGDGFDGGGELGLGQAAHLGDQALRRFQLFAERS